MDHSNLSDIFRSFPVGSGPSELSSLLDGLDTPLTGGFLPSFMMIIPQLYRCRNNTSVKICGTIDDKTFEYAQGYRFFSDSGELFDKDGRCQLGGLDHPCDLVGREDLNTSTLPITSSPYLWVHPQHWTLRTWFKELGSGKTSVSLGERYLNRMGLIIAVTKNDSERFLDDDQRTYDQWGKCDTNIGSMFDLVYEIRHWAAFQEYDWSSDKPLTQRNAAKYTPELFDPTVSNKLELTQRFFATMAEINELADKLGYDLGFTIKTPDTIA